jgi:hypothetical protein
MIPGMAAMGSGSLSASNTVLHAWNGEGYAGKDSFDQYVVWTEGRDVASAIDNFAYDVALDEAHFPGSVSRRRWIFRNSTGWSSWTGSSADRARDTAATCQGGCSRGSCT